MANASVLGACPTSHDGTLCDNGFLCNRCLVAIPASECPMNPFSGKKKCRSAELQVGELCEASPYDYYCGTSNALDNCFNADVYRRIACIGPPAPPPPPPWWMVSPPSPSPPPPGPPPSEPPPPSPPWWTAHHTMWFLLSIVAFGYIAFCVAKRATRRRQQRVAAAATRTRVDTELAAFTEAVKQLPIITYGASEQATPRSSLPSSPTVSSVGEQFPMSPVVDPLPDGLQRDPELTPSSSRRREEEAEAEAADDDDDDVCAVCLTGYTPGEQLRVLPCKHYFHRECIDQWLGERRKSEWLPSCPLCKALPLPPVITTTTDGRAEAPPAEAPSAPASPPETLSSRSRQPGRVVV